SALETRIASERQLMVQQYAGLRMAVRRSVTSPKALLGIFGTVATIGLIAGVKRSLKRRAKRIAREEKAGGRGTLARLGLLFAMGRRIWRFAGPVMTLLRMRRSTPATSSSSRTLREWLNGSRAPWRRHSP